ncbi:MAG: hypothetical protein ACFCVH_03465 [Alphaproteobacteria bacterium]
MLAFVTHQGSLGLPVTHMAEGEAPPALAGLRLIAAPIDDASAKIAELDREIVTRHRADEASRRLATIPGVGSPAWDSSTWSPLSLVDGPGAIAAPCGV